MNRLKHAATGASMLALVACSGSTAVTPAQIAADLSGLVTALAAIEPQIVAIAPNALTPQQQQTITLDIAEAKQAIANFTAGMPAATGATIAQQIDLYINDAVTTLASVAGVIPGLQPYAVPIGAIDAILPEIEAFVNQYLPVSWTQQIVNLVTPAPTPAVAVMAARATMPVVSIQQARTDLGIPTLKTP